MTGINQQEKPQNDDRVAKRREYLRSTLVTVQDQIDAARHESGRTDEVRLCVVTKFHPWQDQVLLAELGVMLLGENRVQEAQEKARQWDELRAAGDGPQRPRLAMIGHIQSKKCGAVARWADEVHSVDSVRVAEGLSRGRVRAQDSAGVADLPCLVQLSLDGDPDRGGVALAEAEQLADRIAELEGLALAGVMVVPPLEGEAARHFDVAAQQWQQIRKSHPGATEFSAGMSADLTAAIAAGSTCVRVGTAIMGPRPIL